MTFFEDKSHLNGMSCFLFSDAESAWDNGSPTHRLLVQKEPGDWLPLAREDLPVVLTYKSGGE
jgi:hypothetical protein